MPASSGRRPAPDRLRELGMPVGIGFAGREFAVRKSGVPARNRLLPLASAVRLNRDRRARLFIESGVVGLGWDWHRPWERLRLWSSAIGGRGCGFIELGLPWRIEGAAAKQSHNDLRCIGIFVLASRPSDVRLTSDRLCLAMRRTDRITPSHIGAELRVTVCLLRRINEGFPAI